MLEGPHGLIESGEIIEATVTEDELTITNNFFHPIYYFAIESELATTINWAVVSRKENQILPFQKVPIKLIDIGVTKKGQKISFSYWKEQNTETKNIQSILIETE